MSKEAAENPPYITVADLHIGPNVNVNMMEWDDRADGYQVSVSKQVARSDAQQIANEWAEREGLELRL